MQRATYLPPRSAVYAAGIATPIGDVRKVVHGTLHSCVAHRHCHPNFKSIGQNNSSYSYLCILLLVALVIALAQGASAELVAAVTMAANGSGLQLATIRNLLMAWVLTLPCAIMLSASLYVLFSQLF